MKWNLNYFNDQTELLQLCVFLLSSCQFLLEHLKIALNLLFFPDEPIFCLSKHPSPESLHQGSQFFRQISFMANCRASPCCAFQVRRKGPTVSLLPEPISERTDSIELAMAGAPRRIFSRNSLVWLFLENGQYGQAAFCNSIL